MRRRYLQVLCIWVAVLFSPLALRAGVVLVEWNFPEETANAVADGGIADNTNRILSAEGVGGTVTYDHVGDGETFAAKATGWDDGEGVKYWLIECSTVDFESITLSSLQRSSDTGPRNFKVQYRLDGSGWQDVTHGTVVCGNNWSSGLLEQLPLPAACDDQDSVAIRWLMADNVSVGAGTVGANGISRIDNIIVHGVRLTLEAPQVLTATDLSAAQFTAGWTAVDDATGYLLDVAVTDAFVAGVPETNQTVVIDFEGDGETKGAYASGIVTLSGLDWELTEVLIGTLTNDWKTGARSARLRGFGTSAMTMQEDLTNGLGGVSFQYRRFATYPQADWRVEHSTDGGTNWTQIGTDFTAPGSDTVQVFSNVVQVPPPVRLRIKRATETGTDYYPLNIDNIVLSSYAPGEFVPGYQARPVPGTRELVTGLERGWYYYRVRAVADGVTSDYSGVMPVRASDTPPPFLFHVR